MIVHIILMALVLSIWPSHAYAWGPGTHLETGLSLIKDAALFSPAIAVLLKKYRDEFIYGMVSPDVLIGKKLVGYYDHSHNWRVGWQILKKCRTDREKASAYGYLAHLAADVVAHNYYVPYMIIKSFDGKMRDHTYWELRFDAHVKPSTWSEVERVVLGDFKPFDRLLEKTLKRPLFSFRTNKNIFRSILVLQRFKQLRRAVRIHARFSQWPLEEREVRSYRYLIKKMTRDLLIRLQDADCFKGDPTGRMKLRYAKGMRRTVRRLATKKMVKRGDIDRFFRRIDIELQSKMFEPGAFLSGPYEILRVL